MVLERPGSRDIPTSNLKDMIYYAARDDMGRYLCSALLDKSKPELKELLEQDIENGLLVETSAFKWNKFNNMKIVETFDPPPSCNKLIQVSANSNQVTFLAFQVCTLLRAEIVDFDGQMLTPLIIASKHGHNTVVKVLVEHFSVDLEHEGCVRIENFYIEGATALWCAAGAGHLSVVKTLVKAGADVNHPTKSNSTPVRAACYDGRLDIVKYLAMHGADFNKPNKYNNTCLMIAAYKGHLEVVKFLLEHKVDPNEQAHCGATALFFASECGHLDVVQELIASGAILIPTDTGISPVMAAAERTRASVVEYLVSTCKLPLNEQINSYELLGASYANDKDNYCLTKAYYYLNKAMKLRYISPEEPILKVLNKPVPAYDNWVECQTLQDLQGIRHNENALHMESLAIRERLLGRENPEVPHPIIYRGAVFADNGHFDRCIALWLHALELTINMKESLVKDLRRFSQLFCQMLNDGIELQFQVVAHVLQVAVVELERITAKFESAVVKDEIYQLKDDIAYNGVTALYLIVVISKLMENRTTEEVHQIHQLVFRLNQLKVTSRGLSLLHLCVNANTPIGNFHTNSVCRFPCANTAKLLIKCGADVDALDEDGNTPLHTIVTYRKPVSDFGTLHAIIKDLVEGGAHLDVVNSRGETPLDAAATGISEIILKSMMKLSLQCMAARAVAKYVPDIDEHVPSHLAHFVKLHGAFLLPPASKNVGNDETN